MDLLGLGKSFYRHRTERPRGDVSFRQSDGRRRRQDRAGPRHLLHASRQMRGLANDGVFHIEIFADGADDNFPRIDPNANFERLLGTVCQFGGRFLDHQCRVTSAHGMILVGQWRAKDRHDAIAQKPVDRTFIVMDGFDHLLEHGIEDRLRTLGVPAIYQLQ